jgi:hypothetical protein
MNRTRACLGTAALALLLLAACGGDLPSRYVIEHDLDALRYRRYQKTLGVEFVVPGNAAQGYTATYLRREGQRVAVATAFVTVYARPASLASEIRERVRGLDRYEVSVEELASGHAFVLDGGPDERWAIWVSDRYVVKLGAPVGEPFPDALVEAYMDKYPSDLDAQGRAQPDATSAGLSQHELAEKKQQEQERERELPRHLGEHAPK